MLRRIVFSNNELVASLLHLSASATSIIGVDIHSLPPPQISHDTVFYSDSLLIPDEYVNIILNLTCIVWR